MPRKKKEKGQNRDFKKKKLFFPFFFLSQIFFELTMKRKFKSVFFVLKSNLEQFEQKNFSTRKKAGSVPGKK